MKEFTVKVLAPLGDVIFQAATALILNGLAWLLAHVYLLQENPAVKTITRISVYAAVQAVGFTLVYASILGAMSLFCRLPLDVVFISPPKRRQYLKEAEK